MEEERTSELLQYNYQQRDGRKARLFVWGGIAKETPMQRTDRLPGNRAAYEKARQQILKTQTICGICGKPVDFSLKYPHPLSPTVDHIIPVAKGGHPTDISNLQLAHRCCNREKSDKLMQPKEQSKIEVLSNRVLPLHNNWTEYTG